MPGSHIKTQYLRTSMGAVKLVNIVFGGISIILIATSYVPIWTLAVFTGIVTSVFCLSMLYLTVYMCAPQALLFSKANKITSFVYHMSAGVLLVLAGIELVGWSDYDSSCKHDCPRNYTVGIAKTLTFINGTLYMIVAFLGMKDDDMLDSESADEDVPLLNSTVVISSIPGSGQKRPSLTQRVSFEDLGSHSFYPRSYPYNSDYPLNNSCSSSLRSGSFFGGDGYYEKRGRSMSGTYSKPATTPFTDLHLIKESLSEHGAK